MFEEDHQESPKRAISSIVLLAAGGAVVATVMATLASMLAMDDEPRAEQQPQPQADVRATTGSAVRVVDGHTSTVVVTVPAAAPKRPGEAAAPGQPEHPEVTRTTTTPARPTASHPAPPTSQPPSNPPTSWTPTGTSTSTSTSSSSVTTAPTPTSTTQS